MQDPTEPPGASGRTLALEWGAATLLGGLGGWGLFYALTGLALTLGGPHIFEGGPGPLAIWFVGLRALVGLMLALAQAAVWTRHRALTPTPTGRAWIAASLGAGWPP